MQIHHIGSEEEAGEVSACGRGQEVSPRNLAILRGFWLRFPSEPHDRGRAVDDWVDGEVVAAVCLPQHTYASLG